MLTSFAGLLQRMEGDYAPRTAFRYWEDGAVRSVTYGQYAGDIRRFAAWLRANVPAAEGRQVGLLARNHYHYAVCLLGILTAGAVAVPLNVEENWDNIRSQIRRADLVCLLHDGDYLQREPALGEAFGGILAPLDGYTQAEPEAQAPARRNPEEMAILMFTSGTTGRSKGVMLSEKNCFTPLRFFVQTSQVNIQMETPRVFYVVPMYHISGLSGLLTWMAAGAALNLCISMKYLYRDLQAMPSDHVSVVPMILQLWYKDLRRGHRERLGELRNISCGGADVDAGLFAAFREAGISVMQGYGLTEIFGGGTMNCSTDPAKSASVGLPGEGCRLKLMDGEVCLKSDAVMLGYYQDPEATAQAIQDGWLHTGDLGYLDEDGYLYLTGRKKNLIILSNGENVSPEELEQALRRTPEVCEVMVGEARNAICAEVYPAYPRGCTAQKREDIRSRIRQAVGALNGARSAFQQIRCLCFREEPFPKTATGKLIRYQHAFPVGEEETQ
ncbi:MAG: acyl--CoA ligase [Clostridiales bacterium]|nr:acyl--CoA ligase [Clostridiales bacterium]